MLLPQAQFFVREVQRLEHKHVRFELISLVVFKQLRQRMRRIKDWHEVVLAGLLLSVNAPLHHSDHFRPPPPAHASVPSARQPRELTLAGDPPSLPTAAAPKFRAPTPGYAHAASALPTQPAVIPSVALRTYRIRI